jgi:hypothetical protein
MDTHTSTVSKKGLVDAHRKAVSSGMLFYGSLGEIRADKALTPYLHVLARAWESLELSGVVCLDGLPTLYLAVRSKPVTPGGGAELQRIFWNQGVATVLVVADPKTVRVYSGLAKPIRTEAATDGEDCLVEALALAEYAVSVRSFLLRLATGSYYRAYPQNFSHEQTVDAYLLNNLRCLRDKLLESNSQLTIETAHTFLARALFACYLIDRGIIDLGTYLVSNGPTEASLGELLDRLETAEERRHLLLGLFSKLKDDFNGSMFERATLTQCRQLSSSALQELTDFLQGHELGTGQYTLDFWAYDFGHIPVETISAVYEDFLKRENESEKRAMGAYYTPRFLAETVIDLAIPNGETLEGKRFLDPACGSGIFLVTLFNRIATAWELEHPTLARDYVRKANALKAILRDQLCGIDRNPTACRIACFSLYLAFLDHFEPRSIREFVPKNGRLPNILHHCDPDANESLDFPVIREDDFLIPTHKLPGEFDYVVGNPPWAGRGPKRGVHHKFVKKIPNHLAERATACVLLPSKTFLNDTTNGFQSEWLREVTLEEVVQLADYSRLLFKEAKCPCMIVRFRAVVPDFFNSSTSYLTPKVSRIDFRDGIVPIAPVDRKEIPLRHLLSGADRGIAPSIWKQHLWGTPKDIKFLGMLQQMPSLGEITDLDSDLRKKKTIQTKRLLAGQGFKPAKLGSRPSDRNLTSCTWQAEERFVTPKHLEKEVWLPGQDSDQLGRHLTNSDCYTDRLYSKPSENLFAPPLLLVNQGFTTFCFFDYRVRFQHSLQSIKAKPGDEDILLFLVAYLQSDLARYFLFHTSANWGVERSKVHLEELLRLPFPLPGSEWVSADAQEIVNDVAKKTRSLIADMASYQGAPFAKELRRKRVQELQKKLAPLVYSYFGIIDQEVLLIEDTNTVSIPSTKPGSFFKDIPSRAQIMSNSIGEYSRGLVVYAEILGKTLNEWAKQSKSEVRVTLSGGVHMHSNMVCLTVKLTTSPEPFREEILSDKTFLAAAKLAESSATRTGCLDYLRGVIVFQGPRIYIFKPTALIGWTRTAALNDAAEIYARIADARNVMLEANV